MSLRDQMLKAGLISEEQARQAAHKQRVDNKQTDRGEREAKRKAARDEAQQQKQAERERHKAQNREQQQARAQQEQGVQEAQRRGSALENAYRDGRIEGWEGGRRYYYAAGGRVECLMVTDDVGRRLEAGQVGIVSGLRNAQRHLPLNALATRQLRSLAPERVLIFHADS